MSEKPAVWVVCDPLPPVPVHPGAHLEIGRKHGCGLLLRHHGISRVHCVIHVDEEGHASVEDKSSNGTFLNGKRVEASGLRPGDEIGVGPYDVEIRSGDTNPGEELEMTQSIDVTSVSRGGLEDDSLLKAIQECEFNKKSGTFKIRAGDLRGIFVVDEGRPHTATLGDLRDDEAVVAMLALKEGRYTFSGCSPEAIGGPVTMDVSVTALLLEHSRREDEQGL